MANYWHMQLHPGDEGSLYTPDHIKAILEAHKVIGFDIWDEPLQVSELTHLIDKPFTEWKDEDIKRAIELAKSAGSESTFGVIRDFRDKMQIGDIVLIRKRDIPIALVKVVGDYFFYDTKDKSGQPWFRHRRKVKVLSYFDEDKGKLGLSFNTLPIGGPTKTLQILVKSGAIRGIIEEWLQKLHRAMAMYIADSLKILEHQRQIILYGPPGTGKTFRAKQMAREIVADCSSILELLDSLWDEFVKYLDEKRFGTFGRGSEFSLRIRDRAADKLAIYINDRHTNLSIYKDKVNKILQESGCNPKEYTSTRDDTDYPYNRVIAEEFIKWLFNNYLNSQVKLVQFHPSYTYEDFVRGIQVETKNGVPVYRTVNRIFAEMCDEAINNSDKNFVLIIDEINRANLPAVLGELIYALEYRGEPVETPYEVNGSRTLIVPENLYIIGTMNTADRSIGHIDYAIRRRFYFLPVRANKRLIEDPKARKLYENTIERIFVEDNMSPEFRDKIEDVKIGHTYFLGNNNEIAHKFVYQVIPLLVEYIQDGILKGEEVVQNVMQGYFEGVENWRELTIEAVINRL